MKTDPEHTRETERWRELVYRGIESDTLDYKAPLDWNKMNHAQRAKLVRHAIAFANTKGGSIVIGVREDDAGRPVLCEGVTPEGSRSFDPSTVGMFFNSCVEPPIDFTIERPVVDGRQYAILVIRPFATLPHVCSRGVTGELQEGVFYIRTQSASSRPAYRAVELHALVQRALRNQREELGRMLRGILYENSTSEGQDPGEEFRAELESSTVYFTRRQKNYLRNLPAGQLLCSWSVRPGKFLPDRYLLTSIAKAAVQAALDQSEFISAEDLRQAYHTNISLRYFSTERSRMWQFFRSGQIHWMALLKEPEQKLDIGAVRRFTADVFRFFGRYYSALGAAETTVDINLHIMNVENWQLEVGGATPKYLCRIPEIEIRQQRSAATLAAGDTLHTDAWVREVADRFNVPPEVPLGAGEA